MMHHRPDDALAFGASGDRDADDFYDFLSSSSSSIDDEDEGEREGNDATRVAGDVAALASVPIDHSAVFTTATSAWRSERSSRLQHQRVTPEELAQLAGGAMSLAGGRELRVAPEALAQHASRKSQLENALDALSLTSGNSNSCGSSGGDGVASGEAPFRFREQHPSRDVEMAAAAGSEQASAAANGAPTSSKSTTKKAAAPPDEKEGADPLYDDGMDDADEKWVQRNFRTSKRLALRT